MRAARRDPLHARARALPGKRARVWVFGHNGKRNGKRMFDTSPVSGQTSGNMKIYPTALLMAAALSLPGAAAAQSPTVSVYVTAKDTGQRLSQTNPLSWMDMAQPSERQQCVFIDPSKSFQTVVGIGGALTDAAAETFYKLPEEKRRQFLRAYFDPQNGIGYTLGRTHINSCDFSSESYTYVTEGDRELNSFDIAHDLKYRVPFIKAALAEAGKDLSLFISPWSPPGWMKDNTRHAARREIEAGML